MGLGDVVLMDRGIDHEDYRRSLVTMFNGDIPGMEVARQIKFLIGKENPAVLGGHYHDYSECYAVLNGKGIWTLEDIETKEQKTVELVPQHTLYIPPGVAHRVTIEPHVILIGATELPYKEAKENDKPYKFAD